MVYELYVDHGEYDGLYSVRRIRCVRRFFALYVEQGEVNGLCIISRSR